MDFRYQAAIARALGKFVERGLVYKGKKPVHWCIHCRTALAEAEVEYEPHTSPSIYVEFLLDASSREELARRVPAAGRPRRGGAYLDDDALDHPVEPGDRVSPGVRVRRVRARRARGVHREGPGRESVRGGKEGLLATRWRRSPALNSTG